MCRQGRCIDFGELLCPGVSSLTYSRALLTLWLSPQVSRAQVQRCALPIMPNKLESQPQRNGCFLQASSFPFCFPFRFPSLPLVLVLVLSFLPSFPSLR